ncbi:preprotein translocase subunit SecY [Desulfurococcus amylolyticus]|uniref:Protein translocase subunit SecY n=1 Tax=Desulfurococcus amylolyticus DSM 16532 TaxID=768672 RepID=I3XT57_DESAM|nr:preprotein translocase subunit SecY [Desulfurococcus amylolyticus]AFL67131.1 preprotein translocase, SecY subunit [Desulfurococcus amylolyticus DSM 16532]
MSLLRTMAKIADYLPTAVKPQGKPSMYERLFWTGVALIVYMIMANTPLYGISYAGPEQILLIQIIFASNRGTLMELGIGPIVTAGLIMQILVGAKLINLDLTDPEDRKVFTASQKTLAVILAAFEAGMYVLSCRYWMPLGNPVTACSAGWHVRLIVWLQLFVASYLVIVLDEMIQKGWGIGSGVSLFILAGVATTIFWNIFSTVTYQGQPIGFIPYMIQVVSSGGGLGNVLIRPGGRDLVGLIATIVIMFILVYLSNMKVEIPVTSPRLQSIKTKIPLQFLYVTNIPVLFVGILYANILVFATLFRVYLASVVPQSFVDLLARYDTSGRLVGGLAYYLASPNGLYSALSDPAHLIVYSLLVFILAVLFGLMWVEVAGLNPAAQAEQLISSGFEVPGLRNNPKILEKILAKYIYPLTVLSSLIVAAMAVLADALGAYGTGTGILLAIGILQQYYALIAYERTLEAYPLLRRLVGE